MKTKKTNRGGMSLEERIKCLEDKVQPLLKDCTCPKHGITSSCILHGSKDQSPGESLPKHAYSTYLNPAYCVKHNKVCEAPPKEKLIKKICTDETFCRGHYEVEEPKKEVCECTDSICIKFGACLHDYHCKPKEKEQGWLNGYKQGIDEGYGMVENAIKEERKRLLDKFNSKFGPMISASWSETYFGLLDKLKEEEGVK